MCTISYLTGPPRQQCKQIALRFENDAATSLLSGRELECRHLPIQTFLITYFMHAMTQSVHVVGKIKSIHFNTITIMHFITILHDDVQVLIIKYSLGLDFCRRSVDDAGLTATGIGRCPQFVTLKVHFPMIGFWPDWLEKMYRPNWKSGVLLAYPTIAYIVNEEFQPDRPI